MKPRHLIPMRLATPPTALVDFSVTMVARALSRFRRGAIDAAVFGADDVAARNSVPHHAPGRWHLHTMGDGAVTDLCLQGPDAPRGVIGRWYRADPTSDAPRPVVVVVHGYNAGDYAIEERLWPRARLAARGVDVVLFVMPEHGVRKPRFGLPTWPNPENLDNTAQRIDQAVRELRGLLGALAADARVSDVSLWGMSLGAYVAGVAAPAADIANFVGVTPLMSLPAFFRVHDVVDDAGASALDAVFGPRCPAAGSLSCPAVVVSAVGDGVTGLSQARAMARWARAKTLSIHGSHLAPVGLGDAFDVVIDDTMRAFAQRQAVAAAA
jgi:pimeloyl-ACP methyl ester carboxylesterase